MITMKAFSLTLGLLLTPTSNSEAPEIEDRTYTCEVEHSSRTTQGKNTTTRHAGEGIATYQTEGGKFRSYAVGPLSPKNAEQEITFRNNAQTLLYNGVEMKTDPENQAYYNAFYVIYTGGVADQMVSLRVVFQPDLGPYDFRIFGGEAMAMTTHSFRLRCY